MKINEIENIDCLQGLKSLPDKCCDIFTDTPYNVGKDYGKMVNDKREDYEQWIAEVLIECKRVSNTLVVYVPKKWNLLFWNVLGSDFQEIILPFNAAGAIRGGFSNQYNKLLTNAKPKGKPILNVWQNMPTTAMGYFFREETYGHPGYTSEAITGRAIKELCTHQLIVDPFAGTGTTWAAAMKLGKDFKGFELNPKFIDIAKNRIFNEVGLFYNV